MAIKKAQALHKVHSRVKGQIGEQAGRHKTNSLYVANEINAMLWVHVTAFYCRVKLYEMLIRPLTEIERNQFCQEARLYAFCFGIPDEVHPQSWQEVENYMAAMVASDTLGRTEAGIKIRKFMERGIPRRVRKALWTFLCVSLPPQLQTMLEQPTATATNRIYAEKVQRRLRWLQRILPKRLACVPASGDCRENESPIG